jgi:hypothetical protein
VSFKLHGSDATAAGSLRGRAPVLRADHGKIV